MALRILLLLGIFGSGLSSGQDTSSVSPPILERNLSALQGVAEPMAAAMGEIDRLIVELNEATSDSQKADVTNQIKSERDRLAQLRANFLEIVGGAESSDYNEQKQQERTLQDQFSDLLDPLVGALRGPTEELRRTEQMRKDLAKWRDLHQKAEQVIARIAGLQTMASDERVKDELEAAKRLWNSRRSDATGNIEVLRLQVEERQRNTPSVWESISGMFRDFWATRGLNLLLALVAAIIAWFLVRKGYGTLRRASPALRRQGTFLGKVGAILSLGAAGIASLLAVILVFFLRGDWLLLTLMTVLLLGMAWASKSALPPYLEQVKMILNLGSVREGERLIYQGLPWEVTSLGFYSVFTNPLLEGGTLRIPLKDVMGMTSRKTDGKEQWFPTKRDDWAILGDGTFGKVIHQTPEQVVMLRLGGMTKTYPVSEFLDQTPENLTRGFRVTTRFGISYDHQAVATTEVAPAFQKALLDSFVSEFGREMVKMVKVEFQTAASSSLDYLILADFNGELAQRMRFIERMMQKVCVEICNEKKWEIPFTQITVHAGSSPTLIDDGGDT